MTDDKMLARIAALLRQAEGTDNTHEAEAFMAAAQRLATATSIDLAVARSHADQRTKAQTPVQRTITIGNAGARGLRTYVQLFVLIANANDVKCDIASNSTFVYAYGFAEDIDASHALYASLVMQMVRASEAYSGWPRLASRHCERRHGIESAVPAPRSRCGTRISSSRTSTASRRRRGARGGPAVQRQATHRRRDGPVTARAGVPSSAPAKRSAAHAPRSTGDRPRHAARQGLRRRRVRPDVVRPRR
jgi:hypothetical protein